MSPRAVFREVVKELAFNSLPVAAYRWPAARTPPSSAPLPFNSFPVAAPTLSSSRPPPVGAALSILSQLQLATALRGVLEAAAARAVFQFFPSCSQRVEARVCPNRLHFHLSILSQLQPGGEARLHDVPGGAPFNSFPVAAASSGSMRGSIHLNFQFFPSCSGS